MLRDAGTLAQRGLAPVARVLRRVAVAALPLGAVLMMWDLAAAQRDPEPEAEIMVCEFGCLVHACSGDVVWESRPPPPPPYVVRDFRTDPIDDEEILDLRSGRTQALGKR